MNQSVGDVGSEDTVSLEGSVQFFAEWGRWFSPRGIISTKSGCLVKNGPIRGLGTLVLPQPTGDLICWTEGDLPGFPSPAFKLGLEN